jgi:hypothetical protein
MNAKRTVMGAIMAITHQIAMVAITLANCNIIINATRMVEKGVLNIAENDSWEILNVHLVPLMRYMGIGTEGLQMLKDEIHADNEGVLISIPERWLANPYSMREMRQRGEISVSSVVIVVKGDQHCMETAE